MKMYNDLQLILHIQFTIIHLMRRKLLKQKNSHVILQASLFQLAHKLVFLLYIFNSTIIKPQDPIPVYGDLTSWQFYATKSGEAMLQVWRPMAKLSRVNKLVGQTRVTARIGVNNITVWYMLTPNLLIKSSK